MELQKQKISNVVKKNNFEQFIREVISALPEHGRKAIDNVAFTVEKKARRPPSLKLRRAGKKAPASPKRMRGEKEIGIKVDEVLLGLYEGVPKTKRGANYFGVLPDKITIFRQPIEELAGRDEKKLKKLIYEEVGHEVGHHLGFNEKEIRALETKKRKIK